MRVEPHIGLHDLEDVVDDRSRGLRFVMKIIQQVLMGLLVKGALRPPEKDGDTIRLSILKRRD
jgi:hypothetical protein